MLVPGRAGWLPSGRGAEVDVEPLQRDLVAAERVEHLARDAGDEQDVVAVGVDVEPGEIERARVEAPARRIHVRAGAVVVAGRVGEAADAGPVGHDGDLLHGRPAGAGPGRRR